MGEGDGGVELGTSAAEAGERRGRGLSATGYLGSERGSHRDREREGGLRLGV